MADPNLSQLLTATFDEAGPEIYDQFTNNNALFSELAKKGNIKEDFSGGNQIRENLAYEENGTYTRYYGGQQVNISERPNLTAAQFPIRQVSVSVSMNGFEEITNMGKAEVVDLLDHKLVVMKKSFENNMEGDLWSNGTADGGLQIGGAQLLVADTPSSGVVGGIDSALWSFWRNYSFSSTSDGGAAATSANIFTYLCRVFREMKRGNDLPDLLIADNNYFGLYESYLGGLQQIVTTSGGGKQGAGAEELVFKNRRFVLGGGRGGQIPSNKIYLFNTDYIKLRQSSKRKLKMRDPVTSINQDLEVRLALWAGNLTICNRFCQGVLRN